MAGRGEIDRRLGAAEKGIALLRDEIERLRSEYQQVLLFSEAPADVVLAKARKTVEGICKCIYVREGLETDGRPARKLMLNDLLAAIQRCAAVPPDVLAHLSYIQACGNLGVHDQGEHNERIREKEFSEPCLKALASVAHWYFEEYCGDVPVGGEPPAHGRDVVAATSAPTDAGPQSTEPTALDSISLSELGRELGLSVGRLINFIREALSVELRTPSAMLSPAHADIVRTHVKRHSAASAGPERTRIQIAPDVFVDMLMVRPGMLVMGSPLSEEGHNDDEIVHEVALTAGFYLGASPVTQRQFEAVVGHNPSYFIGPDLPVEMVSWFDCVAFCETLGERVGRKFRLPTEAEWEYACRASTTTAYNRGHAITTADANFDGWFLKDHQGESRKQTSVVGTFQPNAWGFHDMHGNVWEWCQDWYAEYARKAVKDPRGPADGEIRILRGGSWFHGPADARSAQRDALDPGRRHSIYGFRVAMCC